jgi:hypothetical protein
MQAVAASASVMLTPYFFRTLTAEHGPQVLKDVCIQTLRYQRGFSNEFRGIKSGFIHGVAMKIRAAKIVRYAIQRACDLCWLNKLPIRKPDAAGVKSAQGQER